MIRRLKKKHSTVTMRDLYIHYLDNQEPGEFTLDYEKWKRVMYDVLYKLSRAIIEDNLKFKIEFGMGIFGVEKAKGKIKRRVDFNETKKAGKTIFHTNLHTDCYYFRFVWRKRRTFYRMNPNIKFYKLTPILDSDRREIGKRGLARWVKDCSKDPFKKDYDAPFKLI